MLLSICECSPRGSSHTASRNNSNNNNNINNIPPVGSIARMFKFAVDDYEALSLHDYHGFDDDDPDSRKEYGIFFKPLPLNFEMISQNY